MMQWHVGPVPEGAFAPGPEWRPLDEPEPERLVRLAARYGFVAAALLALGWAKLTPLGFEHLGMPSPGTWALMLPAFALLVLVHELLHAVVHPGLGWSRDTVIGWWPQHGLFYAHYHGELGRNRFVILGLLPLLVISVVPLLAAAWFDIASPWAAGISVLNGLLACGDMFAAAMILRQVPPGGIIRNQGWRSYWRPLTQPAPVRAQN
jgi:hypothetical protein